ncbi:hypothetical protein [Streptomyces sp. 058-1L]|uniref:hypothetical protein n=1 Tax=Streptomyces sp. 058-1L TaxID=2789266 RepID=UPI00397F0244
MSVQLVRITAAEVGDQDNPVTEEWDVGATSHQTLLQFDLGDASFVDAGVVRGGDALGNGVPVFMQSSGETGERGQSAVREVVQPACQGCGVPVVEHGVEPADRVVRPEFRAVVEEPGQAVVDVQLRRPGCPSMEAAAAADRAGLAVGTALFRERRQRPG